MKETKSKYAIYLYPSQMEEIKNLMDQANAKSQSEFVSDAIRFYIGYLQQGKNVDSKGHEGYLSKQSIDSLRSCFGNDVFQQEQYHLFQLQTGSTRKGSWLAPSC